MTTNKPEVVAFLHSDKENPEHRGVSLHHDASCTSTLANTEPLVRLSDYKAMQAECGALVEALKKAGLALHEMDDEHATLADIDNALAAYRKHQDDQP